MLPVKYAGCLKSKEVCCASLRSAARAGEDMPADDACQLMTGDISQAIASTTAALCQLPAPACMQAANIMVSEIGECHEPPIA